MIASTLLGAACFAFGVLIGIAACLIVLFHTITVVVEEDRNPDDIEVMLREVEKSTAG